MALKKKETLVTNNQILKELRHCRRVNDEGGMLSEPEGLEPGTPADPNGMRERAEPFWLRRIEYLSETGRASEVKLEGLDVLRARGQALGLKYGVQWQGSEPLKAARQAA